MIPLGNLENTHRYQSLKQMIEIYKPHHVVTHSLGSSLGYEYLRHNPEAFTIKAYGSPVVDFNPFHQTDRKAHWLDPVAAMDWGATRSWASSFNTHSYQGF